MLGYVSGGTTSEITPKESPNKNKKTPRRSPRKNKQLKVRLSLLFLTFTENILFTIRPVISTTLDIKAYNNIVMGFILHITCTVIADIITLFIYFEAGILYDSAMKKISYFKYKGKVLLSVGIIQSILFLIGPILVYTDFLDELISFWIPAISIISFNIPYFCTLGIIIYVKIKGMKTDEHAKLSRQLIIVISACTGLAGFVAVVGLVSCTIDFSFKWVVLEISWLFGILFCSFIFVLMTRTKNKRKIASNTTVTSI